MSANIEFVDPISGSWCATPTVHMPITVLNHPDHPDGSVTIVPTPLVMNQDFADLVTGTINETQDTGQPIVWPRSLLPAEAGEGSPLIAAKQAVDMLLQRLDAKVEQQGDGEKVPIQKILFAEVDFYERTNMVAYMVQAGHSDALIQLLHEESMLLGELLDQPNIVDAYAFFLMGNILGGRHLSTSGVIAEQVYLKSLMAAVTNRAVRDQRVVVGCHPLSLTKFIATLQDELYGYEVNLEDTRSCRVL